MLKPDVAKLRSSFTPRWFVGVRMLMFVHPWYRRYARRWSLCRGPLSCTETIAKDARWRAVRRAVEGRGHI